MGGTPALFAACRYAGQDGILRPIGNRPVADEHTRAKSADAIGAQDAILPHNFSQLLRLARYT